MLRRSPCFSSFLQCVGFDSLHSYLLHWNMSKDVFLVAWLDSSLFIRCWFAKFVVLEN